MILGLGDVYLGAPCAVPVDPRHRLGRAQVQPCPNLYSRRWRWHRRVVPLHLPDELPWRLPVVGAHFTHLEYVHDIELVPEPVALPFF